MQPDAGLGSPLFGGAPAATAPTWHQSPAVAPPAAATTAIATAPPRWAEQGHRFNARLDARLNGRMLGSKALVLVIVCIALGAVFQGIFYAINHSSLEPEAIERIGIVSTWVFYSVVGVIVFSQITNHIRLRWAQGSAATGVAIGVGTGLALGGGMLALISLIAGHLSTDPRSVVMVSEGDLPHIIAAFLIFCVAAPLVEETLFRGVFLESLRGHGTGFAIWMSAIAFAAWHLNPAALRYYALMGALFGLLYVKRGLVCSMSAHAAFNGVLTVAAVVIALSPGATFSVGDMTVKLSTGWSIAHGSLGDAPAGTVGINGPTGSGVAILAISTNGTAPTVDAIESRISNGSLTASMPSQDRITTAPREIALPAGVGVQVGLSMEGHGGQMIFVPHGGYIYEVIFIDAGSDKAKSDFVTMLSSAHFSQ